MIETLKLRLEKIPLSQIPHFSSTVLDYLNQDPKLQSFISAYPEIEQFGSVIKHRNFPPDYREVLVDVLSEQYRGETVPDAVIQNIQTLKNENCFTITTGHQLNIFTGPLFFIYKIVSTINVCRLLKKHYPQFEFVPVYWMASEDHDFAEINHFQLFGKQYKWERQWQGAVGRMDLEGMPELLDQLNECPELFRKAYLDSDNLSQATLKVVNQLFGAQGLVSIDADNTHLKRLFMPVMKDDLLNQTAFHCVTDATKTLAEQGYKTLVTPREINLFYLEDNSRNRIVQKNQSYEVLDGNLSFSKEEILEQLELHPECFSPNVVLRTLYQETILPNLAYVGGPGELSYWLQFKSTFDHYKIPYPVLIPRNNVLVINKSITTKIEKLGVGIADLFEDPDQLKAAFIEQNAETSLNLGSQKGQLKQTFSEIAARIKEIDGSLTGFIKAEETRALKQLNNIEKRLKKAEEKNQELAIGQLMGIKEKLFPEGTLQERHQNILNFYINNPRFVDDLLEHLDPFDFKFHVLLDDG
jgi:bacillithiol biosynthesis cysteine-adding enzyme BshC